MFSKVKKLNQTGFGHLLAIGLGVGVVALVAVTGYVVIGKSSAYVPEDPVASGKFSCVAKAVGKANDKTGSQLSIKFINNTNQDQRARWQTTSTTYYTDGTTSVYKTSYVEDFGVVKAKSTRTQTGGSQLLMSNQKKIVFKYVGKSADFACSATVHHK